MGCRNVKMQLKAVVPLQPSKDDSSHEGRSEGFQHVYQRLSALQPELPEDDAIHLAAVLSSTLRLKEAISPHFLLQSYANPDHSDTEGGRGLTARIMYSELKSDGAKRTMEKAFSDYVDEFAYGPVEAAVQIGNVLLTWNHTSLVIPLLVGEEGGASSASSSPLLGRGRQSTTGESLPHSFNYDKHFNIPLTSDEHLDQVMETVINTIVAYNTRYRYGLFSRNCQHFVKSILRAVGVKNHRDLLPSQTTNHSQVLRKRGCKVNVEEFNSHVELDNYVRPHIDVMDSDDVRFCYCSYLLFHAMESCVTSQEEEKSAWKCDRRKCQFKEVQKRY